jgi:flagellar hook protein FlgE
MSTNLSPIQLTLGQQSPPSATSEVQVNLNLDSSAAANTSFSTPVTIYDPEGQSHVLTFDFTNTSPNNWTYQLTLPAADTGAATPTVVSSGSLVFDGSGQLTSPAANLTDIQVPALANGASAFQFNWNLFNGTSPLITQTASASSSISTYQDGYTSGNLSSFNIGSDGTITGTFSNGQTSTLGQLALATFANPDGLSQAGGNNLTDTTAAGSASIGVAGTGGRGTLTGSTLEGSNVDIAQEFAKLLVAQRGYQANAKALTTLDQITQETIDLKQ